MLTYIKKQRIQMALNIQLIRLSKKYNTSLPKLVLDKNNLSESVRAEEIDGDIFIELFNALYFPVGK